VSFPAYQLKTLANGLHIGEHTLRNHLSHIYDKLEVPNRIQLYVLAQRDNATSRDFGLLTGAAAQRDLVYQLARRRPPVIVRWTDPLGSSAEPNRRGRSSGVHLLDAWIAAHYRPLAVLYHYTVLVRR